MRSSTSHHAPRDAHDRARELALWTGVLAGPAVWLMLLEFNYALSYRACETQETWFLHLATLVSAAAVAAAGFWGWSASRGWRQLPERLTPPVGHETSETRARWMGHASVAFSIWFVIVILTMEIPLIVLRTCQ